LSRAGGRRLLLAAAAAAVLTATGPLASSVLAAAPKPAPGSVAIGATAADPGGGPPWAVRSWRPRPSGRANARCLQVGRLAGARMVRRRGGQPQRPLRIGERSVCGTLGRLEEAATLVVERLVDDPTAPEPVLTQTLVAGVAQSGVREVELKAAGVRHTPAIEPRTRTFLAVLDGRVRRSELVVRMRGAGGTQTLDLGGRAGDIVPGSARHALTLPDPRGGRPFTLTTYEQEVSTVHGPRRERCAEPGRLVNGEAGPYEPSWGSFLDAPTLIDLTEPEDAWPPVAPPAFTIESCLYAVGPPFYAGLGGVGAKRMARGQVVVHGFASPKVERVEVLAPDGSRPEVALGTTEPRAFLAAVPLRGVREERIELTAVTRDGRRLDNELFTGRHAEPLGWQRYATHAGGRRLLIRWLGGFEPFAHVELRERPRRVGVTVHELFAPDFAPNGIPYASPAIGIPKCIEIRLARLLGGRPVFDGHARDRRPGNAVRPDRCRRVSPRRL
jgi:hypothetical protein